MLLFFCTSKDGPELRAFIRDLGTNVCEEGDIYIVINGVIVKQETVSHQDTWIYALKWHPACSTLPFLPAQGFLCGREMALSADTEHKLNNIIAEDQENEYQWPDLQTLQKEERWAKCCKEKRGKEGRTYHRSNANSHPILTQSDNCPSQPHSRMYAFASRKALKFRCIRISSVSSLLYPALWVRVHMQVKTKGIDDCRMKMRIQHLNDDDMERDRKGQMLDITNHLRKMNILKKSKNRIHTCTIQSEKLSLDNLSYHQWCFCMAQKKARQSSNVQGTKAMEAKSHPPGKKLLCNRGASFRNLVIISEKNRKLSGCIRDRNQESLKRNEIGDKSPIFGTSMLRTDMERKSLERSM